MVLISWVASICAALGWAFLGYVIAKRSPERASENYAKELKYRKALWGVTINSILFTVLSIVFSDLSGIIFRIFLILVLPLLAGIIAGFFTSRRRQQPRSN